MSRLQLALNVNDLDASVAFYSKMFNTEPAKLREGYANFAIVEPPLKLVLLENPGTGGSLNHLGVEVEDTDAVESEQTRLSEAGLASVEERESTCCYAKQDKFWVKGTRTESPGRSTPFLRTARPSGVRSALSTSGSRPPPPSRTPQPPAADWFALSHRCGVFAAPTDPHSSRSIRVPAKV